MKKKQFLILLIAFILVVPAVSVSVSAEENGLMPAAAMPSGKCGDHLTWTIVDGNSLGDGTLIISGSGDMYDYSRTTAPWYSSRSTFRQVVLPEGLTSIGDYAFYYGNITGVTIPDTVTSIGKYAFSDCYNLYSVDMSDSVKTIEANAFYCCSKLTEITIPEGVTTIEAATFYGCKGMTSITLPKSLTSIEKNAFRLCDSLEDIYYAGSRAEKAQIAIDLVDGGNEDLQKSWHHLATSGPCGTNLTWSFDAESGTLTISGTGKMYNPADYFNCEWYDYRRSIKEVILPEGLTSIGTYAFYYCDQLLEIAIPDSVTSINKGAFLYCKGLTDVYYDGTEAEWNQITIEEWNDQLTNATIHYKLPASGKCGENLIWEYDDESTALTITGTGAMYDYDEDDIPWEQYKDSITTVFFPTGITTIGYGAFYDHNAITSVTIPDSVTSVKSAAFGSCGKLETVDLGDGCSLGDEAFALCPIKNLELGNSDYFGGGVFTSGYLTSLTITADSPRFDETAFFSCSNLTEVHFKGSAPTLVTDKGWVSASFLDKVTWYYDCSQSGWLSSGRYSAANKTWAGYQLLSEKHAYEEKAVSPTCTERGYNIYKCPCGDSYIDTDTYVSALGHNYDEVKFHWAEGLSSVTVTAVCGCGAEFKEKTAPVWNNAVGRLMAEVSLQVGTTTVRDELEIRAVRTADGVTVSLPRQLMGIRGIAAAYDGQNQMTGISSEVVTGETVMLPVTGQTLRVFLLGEMYDPVLPVLIPAET